MTDWQSEHLRDEKVKPRFFCNDIERKMASIENIPWEKEKSKNVLLYYTSGNCHEKRFRIIFGFDKSLVPSKGLSGLGDFQIIPWSLKRPNMPLKGPLK